MTELTVCNIHVFKQQIANIVLLHHPSKFHCNWFYFGLDMTFYVKGKKRDA